MSATAQAANPAGERHAPAALYTALMAMTALWSMNYYAAKVLTAKLSAFPAAGMRSWIACTGVMFYFFLFGDARYARVTRKQMFQYMGLGAIGVAVNQYFFMEGMSRTSVSHGALIIALTPAIVLVLAAIFGLERITAMKVAGLALATLGIAFLQGGADRNKGSSLLGDALVLTGATAFAAYTVMSKRMARQAQAPGMAVVAYGFLGSSLAFVPGLIWALPRVDFASVPNSAWVALVYMSLGASAICYVIYYRALEFMPASRVSALSYLQPLLAISTAIPLLGEPITKPLVAGGVLILLGVLLAERG